MIAFTDFDIVVREHIEPVVGQLQMHGPGERPAIKTHKRPPPGSASYAVFSPETTGALYRYALHRQWGEDQTNVINWVMLNPSTADEFVNDPTLLRCQCRAYENGFDGFIVTNAFARRSTDPDLLAHDADPVGPHNDAIIAEIAKLSRVVVVGWGDKPNRKLQPRKDYVRDMLIRAGVAMHALNITTQGNPYHPLYVAFARHWKRWDVEI